MLLNNFNFANQIILVISIYLVILHVFISIIEARSLEMLHSEESNLSRFQNIEA